MDVNGHHVHPRRSVGALPPITVQQLVYDPVRMGGRETPIADETGDTRPFLRQLCATASGAIPVKAAKPAIPVIPSISRRVKREFDSISFGDWGCWG